LGRRNVADVGHTRIAVAVLECDPAWKSSTPIDRKAIHRGLCEADEIGQDARGECRPRYAAGGVVTFSDSVQAFAISLGQARAPCHRPLR